MFLHTSMWLFKWMLFCGGLVCGQKIFGFDGVEEVPTSTPGGFGALQQCGEGDRQGLDKCVEYYRCDGTTNTIIPDEQEVNKYGFGIIDIRFGANSCPHPLEVCCKIPTGVDPGPGPGPGPTTSSTQRPVITPEPVPPTQPPITPSNTCGIRNNNGIDFKITGNNHNEAEYGEFPWMVAILKKNYVQTPDSPFSICGGSLITPQVVLTGARCVKNLTAGSIKVRAGEWDTQTEKERLPYQERDVARIIIHEEFEEGVLFNNVALLVLSRPFKKAQHIGTICLPNQGEEISSRNCIANGWGKDVFGQNGQYQMILKKIELPTVPRQQCQSALRETRLGKYFELHRSFMCAGGEAGKDTCTGDGGSPLVCPDPKNPSRYVQAGIVSWGIGCGSTAPGVYADVTKFRSWVDNHIRRLNLSVEPYTV